MKEWKKEWIRLKMQHKVRLAKHNSEYRQCGGQHAERYFIPPFALVLSQLSLLKGIHNSGACVIQ